MPRVTPVEVHGDLSLDDQEMELAPKFETETAVAVAEPVEPIDYRPLENFVEAYGANRLAAPSAWVAATAIEHSRLHNSLRDRELSQVSRPAADDNHKREAGLRASDFLGWMKRSGVAYSLTQVARTSLETSVAEAVEARSLWSLDAAVRDLGVNCDALRAAIQRGELRNTSDRNTCATTSYIEPASLSRWLESRNEPIRLSLEFASFLIRQRQHSSTVEQGSPSIIDEALDSLASELAADEADAAANLRAMRRAYTSVLRRRAEPLPGDARDLVELARQLGLNRAEIERDAATLEAADALAHQATKIGEAVNELNSAGEQFAELKLRHKAEEAAARLRLRNAQSDHAAAIRSPHELEAIRTARPELFGQ